MHHVVPAREEVVLVGRKRKLDQITKNLHFFTFVVVSRHCPTVISYRIWSSSVKGERVSGSGRVPATFSTPTFKSSSETLSCFFFGVPGRVHLLGGESPPRTRQGEPLAFQKADVGHRRQALLSSRSQQSYQSRQRTQPGNPAMAVSALGRKHKLWFTGSKSDGAGHAQCLHLPDQVRTE